DATFEATRAFAAVVTITAVMPGSRRTLWSTTGLAVCVAMIPTVVCATARWRMWSPAPPKTQTPTLNCRIEPPLTVTWLCPAVLSTPVSQVASGGQEGTRVPSPSMTCPLRSRVMLSAPITSPLSGQFTRSLASLVFTVITSPQCRALACARPPEAAVRPPAGTTPTPSLTRAAFQPPRLMIATNRPETYSDDNIVPPLASTRRGSDEQHRETHRRTRCDLLPELYEPTTERCPG